MFLADTLSRACLENELVKPILHSGIRSIKERVFALEPKQIIHGEDVSVSPARLMRLREMTSNDEESQILSNVIYDGWPETLSQAREFDRGRKQVIELHWNCKDELTTDDGLVYRGHRLVIPTKERANIVMSLHESHIGIEGTRDIVY